VSVSLFYTGSVLQIGASLSQ